MHNKALRFRRKGWTYEKDPRGVWWWVSPTGACFKTIEEIKEEDE